MAAEDLPGGDPVKRDAVLIEIGQPQRGRGRSKNLSKVDNQEWKGRLVRTRDLEVKPTTHNLKLIVSMDTSLRGLFAFNELASRVELTRPAPWGGAAGKSFVDVDATELAAWLGQPETYRVAAKPASIAEVVQAVAEQSPFHPVLAYLDALAWDGCERIGTELVIWLGAALGEYTARALRMTLVSAVARAYEPGCKVDTMLVLEGQQGAGKTRFTRELFGADWYAEAMTSPGDKDFFQALQGRWVIEIGEMESFTKAEVGKIKQAVTAQQDTFRASYARFARSYPRRCVFVGTTNEDQYLRDPTGGRRFLPVRVSMIDVGKVVSNRDQLWAEAVHLYRSGFDYWTLPAAAHDEQEARYQADAWEEAIERWLAGGMPESAYPSGWNYLPGVNGVRSCLISEVLTHALKLETGRQDMQAQKRAAHAMRRLGWERRQERRDGVRASRWLPRVPF
jgi:predicted P-loop ATPase